MMADDTAGLMDALGIGSAHVLGLSMGGCIAQELALKYPQRVGSMILAATLARPYPRSSHILRTLAKMNREGISRESHVRLQLFWLFTAKFFEDPEQVQMVVDGMMANPYEEPAHAYDRKLDAVGAFDTRDRLREITAPTMVIVGKEDILTPPILSEEIAARIPNAELVVLEGGGHAFSGEIWQDFNRAVLDFLRRQPKLCEIR
jgi:pimeloyl-ACP methyl ester carboxylesterase